MVLLPFRGSCDRQCPQPLPPKTASLVVVTAAALQISALDVSTAVVRPWHLHSILVHAPADAPLAAAGRLALWCSKEGEKDQIYDCEI